MSTHWTAASIDDFVHRLSFDFMTQLAKRLESSPINKNELAERLRVSKGRVSQVFNNPGNITLKRAVEYARALGMKVSVVAYDDHDPNNHNGPISSEIFSICWQRAGEPADFETAHGSASFTSTATSQDNDAVPDRKGFVLSTRSANSGRRSMVLEADNVEISELSALTNEQRSVAA
jgi:transcriptional regulator with XRE-family HTH domain